MTTPARTSKRGAKPRTSRAEILRAALSLLDSEGVEAVSMRRVAAELGITAMPLYGYFENKDALLNAMIVEAFPGIAGDVDLEAPWQEQLVDVMRQLRDALTRHPGALDLLLSRADPELDPIRETLIRILRTAGFDASQSVTHLTMLVSYAIGSVVISHRRGDPAAEIHRIRGLAPECYPQLRRAAAEYAGRGSQDTYEQSLQLLISALTSTVTAKTTTGPEQP